jgi:hypothetical protein
MRSYICISHEGTPFKLVWVNEDSKGVYLGLYGAVQGTHFSYHIDGTKHFKFPDSPNPQQQHQGTPISSIQSFQQIAFQAFQLIPSTMYIAGHIYQKEDQASSIAVFLDGSLFADKTLAIDAYLINRAKELDFIKFLYSRSTEDIYKIIACNVFALTNFSTHKIGLVILSGVGVVK